MSRDKHASDQDVRMRSPSLMARALIDVVFAFPRLRPTAERLVRGQLRRRLIAPGLVRGYQEFNRLGTMPRGNFVDDFTLYQAAEVLGTVGTFQGAGALDEVIAELREAFDDVRFTPEGIRRLDGDRLIFIVRFSGIGRGSGVRVDRQIAHTWTMRGLRASRLEVYWEPAEALEAAGLPG